MATNSFKYLVNGALNRLVSNIKSKLAKVAFTGSYIDLTNKPTIPAAVAVKGNNESAYRTGNVNLTPANIGAFPGTIEIPNGANLNNYTTPGVYSGSASFSYGNSPANVSFVLIVAKGGNFIRQTFLSVNAISSGEYSRYFNPSNSTWIAWEPNVIQVKGNAESSYRGGQVNLTPANIGALSLTGGTVTGKTNFLGGTSVRRFDGGGVSGYWKLGTFTITSGYANQFVHFEIVQRGRSGELFLCFANVSHKDPSLYSFTRTGNIIAYMHKQKASTWNLYLQKEENYGGAEVTSFDCGAFFCKYYKFCME